MADEDVCFTCSSNERLDLPSRERIYVGPGWRVAHASSRVMEILTLDCAVPVCSTCSARTRTEAFPTRQWMR
jgi:hypothetical protein